MCQKECKWGSQPMLILSCCCCLIYHLLDQIISSWWDFAGSSSCCCFDSSFCFLLWSLVDPLQQLWSSNALQTLVLVDPYNFERSPSPGWSRATISFSDSTSAYSLPSVESLVHLWTSAIVRSKGQSYSLQLWRGSLSHGRAAARMSEGSTRGRSHHHHHRFVACAHDQDGN